MAGLHPLSASALFDLKGWVAVVTGGGTGIGLMAAQTLAANGAKVYITGRRKDVLDASAKAHGADNVLGKSGGSLVPLVMDITSKDSIAAAVAHVTTQDGYLNLLVNNAGIGSDRAHAAVTDGPDVYSKAMFAEDINDWQQVYMSNCTSIYFMTSAFVPLLCAAKSHGAHASGSVINIASISGITKWSQNSQFAYNCSKAGAVHLTRMLAYELSNETIGVRVNAIAPGYFPSELTTGSSDSQNKTTWDNSAFQAEMKRVGANVPIGRPGKDQEMASAILTLATNGYMLGSVLVVDGGLLLRHPAAG